MSFMVKMQPIVFQGFRAKSRHEKSFEPSFSNACKAKVGPWTRVATIWKTMLTHCLICRIDDEESCPVLGLESHHCSVISLSYMGGAAWRHCYKCWGWNQAGRTECWRWVHRHHQLSGSSVSLQYLGAQPELFCQTTHQQPSATLCRRIHQLQACQYWQQPNSGSLDIRRLQSPLYPSHSGQSLAQNKL